MKLRNRVIYLDLVTLNEQRFVPGSKFATASDVSRLAARKYDQAFIYLGGDVFYKTSRTQLSMLTQETALANDPAYQGVKYVITGCRVLWED